MDRRTVCCRLIGGVAVSGVQPFAFQLSRRDRVVIAGGGILGANIAYQLAKRGAAVTLLDRAVAGSGATANSFAWINARKQPLPYYALNLLGIQAWRELHAELGSELPVTWGGTIEWTSTAERAAAQAEAVRRLPDLGISDSSHRPAASARARDERRRPATSPASRTRKSKAAPIR